MEADARRRWLIFGAVSIGTVALLASAVEIFHATAEQTDRDRQWQVPQEAAVAHTPGSVAPARSYTTLRDGRRGPNAGWKSHLNTLVSKVEPEVAEGRAERYAEGLAKRAETRAYAGAPPTIPHRIQQRSTRECVACHQQGAAATQVVIDGNVASPMPHPYYTNCTQCHASSDPDGVLEGGLEVVNTFVGLQAAGSGGQRAWPGAPPTMPHSTLNRENCATCHGPMGTPGLRTTHPERKNCTQCHAASATLDQRGFMAAPPLPQANLE